MSDQEDTAGPPELESVKARVQGIMQAEGKTMKALAAEAGIAYGTFAGVIGGSYAGRVEEYLQRIAAWIDSRQAKVRLAAMMPAAPGYVETPTSRVYLGVLEHAQYMPDLAVITGAPGTGKTMSLAEYQRRAPNIWVVTVQACGTTVQSMLEEIAWAAGINGTGVASYRLVRELIHRFRNTQGLLVMDEAQNLESKSLDQLRQIHDLAGIGVVLVGNETVFAKLEGGTRAQHFAQLFRRVGMRVKRLKPETADIGAILDAWGITDADLRRLLKTIALKPGALGVMTKALRLAHMLAAGEDDGVPLSAAHIEAGWKRISGDANLHGPAAALEIYRERKRAPTKVAEDAP